MKVDSGGRRVGLVWFLVAMSIALSSCASNSSAPNPDSLDQAAQSISQIEAEVKREDVENCQGDSATGRTIYLNYLAAEAGQSANDHWVGRLAASGWKRDRNHTAFEKIIGNDKVIAVFNENADKKTYAIVLYLEHGELSCPKSGS